MAQTILGISGSLRKESNSTAILKTLAARAWSGHKIQIHDLADIPLYNGDLDGDTKPPAVDAFKNAIALADGLLIVSPEYNYGMSGVLKNALDWASRPGYKSVLKDKPVMVLTSSRAGTGGARAHEQIRKTLYASLSVLVPFQEVAIPTVTDKLSNGELTEEKSLKLAVDALQALLDWPKKR